MSGPPPEGELLRECIRRHYEAVYLYAFRRCRDEDTAAEVTIETFSLALRRLDTLRSEQKQFVWLLGIARNKLREARRRKSRKKRMEAVFSEIWPDGQPDGLFPLFASGAIDPLSATEETQMTQLIWEAARALPDDQREALMLKYAEQLPSEDIARVMKRSRRTVDRLIERARQRIYSVTLDSEDWECPQLEVIQR